MPFYRFGNMMAHIRLTNTVKHPAPAQCRALHVWSDGVTRACSAMSTRACDAPIGSGHTCSMPICEEHATRVGDDLDLCPVHAAARVDVS